MDFQKSTLPLYEMIGFRSERILTLGDTAFWIIYPEAFTSIIDVVDRINISAYLTMDFSQENS